MDMLKRLRRLACRHEYGWSERRQTEVCYHCGQLRPGGERVEGRPARGEPPAD